MLFGLSRLAITTKSSVSAPGTGNAVSTIRSRRRIGPKQRAKRTGVGTLRMILRARQRCRVTCKLR